MPSGSRPSVKYPRPLRSGVFYRLSKGKIICAVIGEVIGTGIIGTRIQAESASTALPPNATTVPKATCRAISRRAATLFVVELRIVFPAWSEEFSECAGSGCRWAALR